MGFCRGKSVFQIAFKRLGAILLQRKVDEVADKFSSDRRLQVSPELHGEREQRVRNAAKFPRGIRVVPCT